MLTDGRRTKDAGVSGILIAHLGAFGSGELKKKTGPPPDVTEYSESAHGLGKNILLCESNIHQTSKRIYLTTFIMQMYANLSHDRSLGGGGIRDQ